MSNFTVMPPEKATLITLEASLKGQVDIMVHPHEGESFRIAALGEGKVHLFRQNLQEAEKVGLLIDDDGYPHIRYVHQ